MSDASHGSHRGPFQRQVEAGVAIAAGLFGIVVMIGSLQVGIDWGAEGPKAGFFPFYVGLIIVVSSAFNLFKAVIEIPDDALFADWEQLRLVMMVVVPTAVYVSVLPYIGIYLASILLIAAFMKRFGRYPWGITLAVALGVPLATYLAFERWFLVPLPKGPIEDFLGL